MTCIQQISFYGLAGYDAACAYARVLGKKDCLKILRASLREKRDAVAEEATILKGLLR
jgi:ferritin-like metal-binding protein YciE